MTTLHLVHYALLLTHMLEIQLYKCKTHGFCIFSCFGPHIWKSPPQDLRHCSTLSSFKAKLKNLPLLTVFSSQLISVPSFCYSQCVCVCGGGGGSVCVCSAFVVRFCCCFCIILYVNCFGRTMLYMCIEYHI